MEITLSKEFDFVCNDCGEPLTVHAPESRDALYVDACETCTDAARDQGYDDGYQDGKDD